MKKLFTYGTLQEPETQDKLFKRILIGTPDVLTNYECKIGVVEIDGRKFNALVAKEGSKVKGTTYELSTVELLIADEYEGKDYKRIEVNLLSGTKAFVYILA